MIPTGGGAVFDTKIFGAYLSRLRKAANMTQSELADKLNLTRQAISKYETGDSFPDISILIEIANIYEITIDDLIKSGNPSALGTCSNKLKEDGIDITNIVSLVQYLNDNDLHQLINSVGGILNEKLLEKVIAFLDTSSKETIIKKIIDGESDWRLLRIILPYAEDMTMQLEAAFVDGALPKEAHDMINDYWINKYRNQGG